MDTLGEPKVGGRGTFHLAKGIKGMLTHTITELEPNRLLSVDIEHPKGAWHAVSRLEPDGEATRFRYLGEEGLRDWRRLLEPFMAGELRSREADEARALKALLEPSPTT